MIGRKSKYVRVLVNYMWKCIFIISAFLDLPIKTRPLFTAYLIQLSSAILLGSEYELRVTEARPSWDVKRCPTHHNFNWLSSSQLKFSHVIKLYKKTKRLFRSKILNMKHKYLLLLLIVTQKRGRSWIWSRKNLFRLTPL